MCQVSKIRQMLHSLDISAVTLIILSVSPRGREGFGTSKARAESIEASPKQPIVVVTQWEALFRL